MHQKGSMCEHPRMQRQMWVGSTWFKSQCICGMTNIHLWIHVCIQRASKCERSHGHWRMWVRTTRVRIQRIYDTSSTAQDGGGNFQNKTPIVGSFSLTLMQFHLLMLFVLLCIMYLPGPDVPTRSQVQRRSQGTQEECRGRVSNHHRLQDVVRVYLANKNRSLKFDCWPTFQRNGYVGVPEFDLQILIYTKNMM